MGLRRAMWFVVLVLAVGVVAPVSAVAVQRFLALGQNQFAANQTTLRSNDNQPTLRLRNAGGKPALRLETGAGIPPLAVNRAARVPKLNADRVDGKHASFFASKKQLEDIELTPGPQGEQGPQGEPGVALLRTPPADNTVTTIDSTGFVGAHTSATIGADGLGLISYHDATNQDLKVAHCDNTACTTATTSTIDSAGTVGQFTSVTIGADGLGLISYYDATNQDLKVAHCDNTACTTATITAIDTTGNVGENSSVTIGTDGLGLISYHDAANNSDLKVAHCENTACTTVTATGVDATPQSVGVDSSVTIGADGLGLISYYDLTNQDLKVAHCENTACTTATTTAIDTTAGVVGQDTSVTIGADGLGLISYYHLTNGDLKVAHCENTACTTATTTSIDTAGTVGAHTSVTIGADGLGLISYQHLSDDDLKVAHCADVTCTTATTTSIDATDNDVGGFTSITIGADGLGLISYYDSTNGDLKVAHCANTFCTPYLRRR